MAGYEYLVLFPIPEPYKSEIEELMRKVEEYTLLPAPSKKLCPHVTFYRNFEYVKVTHVIHRVQKAVLQSRKTRVTVDHISSFNRQYIVLPVHTTLSNAFLWTGINELLGMNPASPKYMETYYDNTLHITIAEKTSKVFDRAWPLIKQLEVKRMDIPLEKIALYKRSDEGGEWKMIAEFPLPI